LNGAISWPREVKAGSAAADGAIMTIPPGEDSPAFLPTAQNGSVAFIVSQSVVLSMHCNFPGLKHTNSNCLIQI
jgi:hypothetical protein